MGNTHIVAGGAEIIPDVLSLLKKEGVATQGSPDLYIRTYRSFGIDDARELRERSALRPLGERRVFVIAASDMNREAQSALLKTLEEPSANALFILVLPSPEMLLPTLRSRAQTLTLAKVEQQAGMVDAKQFLSALPQKRLDLLKPLLEKGEDDKRNLGAILAFLASLERVLGERTKTEGLRALYRARKYVTDRGALVKPLLEQMALLVPKL